MKREGFCEAGGTRLAKLGISEEATEVRCEGCGRATKVQRGLPGGARVAHHRVPKEVAAERKRKREAEIETMTRLAEKHRTLYRYRVKLPKSTADVYAKSAEFAMSAVIDDEAAHLIRTKTGWIIADEDEREIGRVERMKTKGGDDEGADGIITRGGRVSRKDPDGKTLPARASRRGM